jgi:hypothetical protein
MSLNGSPATPPMICYSDHNFITLDESWNVQAYNITQIGTLSGPFAGTTAEYNELGYLGDQLFADRGNADLQQALWAVLGLGGTPNADYTNAVSFVTTHPTYMTKDVFYIPVGDFSGSNYPYGTPQPFISQVPEPSSLVLLGAGLLALVGLSFKKAIA